MKPKELVSKIDEILDNSKTGVLATTDKKKQVHTRWMTPAVLTHGGGARVFCFSIPGAAKIEHIGANSKVEWLIQTKDLREIVNIEGEARVVDNPSLKSELMEILGPRLAMFYKVNAGSEDWVTIETRIQRATYFRPISGVKETVEF